MPTTFISSNHLIIPNLMAILETSFHRERLQNLLGEMAIEHLPHIWIMILKLLRESEPPRGFLKTQIPGPWLQSFRWSRSGMGPKNVHFEQIPKWCWCCWSRDYTSRTTGPEEMGNHGSDLGDLRIEWNIVTFGKSSWGFHLVPSEVTKTVQSAKISA